MGHDASFFLLLKSKWTSCPAFSFIPGVSFNDLLVRMGWLSDRTSNPCKERGGSEVVVSDLSPIHARPSAT
jgi:hypothetical protein